MVALIVPAALVIVNIIDNHDPLYICIVCTALTVQDGATTVALLMDVLGWSQKRGSF